MIFWRIFGFVSSNISAMFLCCRGDIVKILCSLWKNPWKCSNGFWSGKTWKFKTEVCYDFSLEEALEKIESGFKVLFV